MGNSKTVNGDAWPGSISAFVHQTMTKTSLLHPSDKKSNSMKHKICLHAVPLEGGRVSYRRWENCLMRYSESLRNMVQTSFKDSF